ncbi:MAG TPA: hypothetical protein VGH38_16520 [Bryobacteraceae bacterium]|jgi:hypothetical protein
MRANPGVPTPQPHSREIGASDGFGPLAPVKHRRSAACNFCLDASTHWRSENRDRTAPEPSTSVSAAEIPTRAGLARSILP